MSRSWIEICSATAPRASKITHFGGPRAVLASAARTPLRLEPGAVDANMITNAMFAQQLYGLKAREVAERHWKLASYEVAGRAPKQLVRPGGTPDFRHPVAPRETPTSNCHLPIPNLHFWWVPQATRPRTSVLSNPLVVRHIHHLSLKELKPNN